MYMYTTEIAKNV